MGNDAVPLFGGVVDLIDMGDSLTFEHVGLDEAAATMDQDTEPLPLTTDLLGVDRC